MHEIDRQQLTALGASVVLVVSVAFNICVSHWRIFHYLHESGASLMWGLVVGSAIYGINRRLDWNVPSLDPDTFSSVAYIFLLPPIIFNAGFTMKKSHFFRVKVNIQLPYVMQNLGTILSFAVLGTLITGLVIGFGLYALKPLVWKSGTLFDCLVVGAVLSAIDTVATLAALRELKVDLMLHSIVFGESVLNDAVAITLFNTLSQFSDVSEVGWVNILKSVGEFLAVCVLSVLVGLAVGFICSFGMKKVKHYGLSSAYETSVVLLCAYISYSVAQVLFLSGVVSLFVCGTLLSHYAFYSVSREARVTLFHISGTFGLIADTTMFISVGLTLFSGDKPFASGAWNMPLTLSVLGLVIAARAATVFPISAIANISRRRQPSGSLVAEYSRPIPFKYAFLMFYANLRGGVALILALNAPESTQRRTIVNVTYLVVLITNTLIGASTKPVALALHIPSASETEVEDAIRDETQLHPKVKKGMIPINHSVPLQQHQLPIEMQQPNAEQGTCQSITSTFDMKTRINEQRI
ncbi:sodium/hydrogen exchanger, Na+/H+ exchanger, antiporter [Pelomyxa schiedti]|nr:sodium/hydrogen exchanger, Na+/H+ exchanger, antiporter [Pelomyxa schiedti]